MSALDTEYFRRKMELIIRDLSHYNPQEMARELVRLAKVADESETSKEAAQATPEGADLPPLPEDMNTVECIQLSSIDSPEFAELMGAYASAPTLDAAWAVLQYADKRMHAIMARRFALAASQQEAEPVLWVESEPCARHLPLSEIINSVCHTVMYHHKKPMTDNPVWPLYDRAAPPQQVDTNGLPG